MSLFREMRETIIERGLAHGTLYDESGKCCIVGAYGIVRGLIVDMDYDPDSTYDAIRDDPEAQPLLGCSRDYYKKHSPKDGAIAEKVISNVSEIFEINDGFGEKAVFEVLDCAIAKEEE